MLLPEAQDVKVESAEEKSEKSVGVGVLGWLGTGSNCREGMMILQSPSRSGVWQIWYAEKNASAFFKSVSILSTDCWYSVFALHPQHR